MGDRWVSYIYRYKGEQRCENAGYVKINRTSQDNIKKANIEIGLKLCKPFLCRCRVYFVYGENKLVLFDEVLVKPQDRESIVLKKALHWNGFLKDDYTPEDYDGIFFSVDDGDTLLAEWKQRNVDISGLKTPVEKKEESVESSVAIDPVQQLLRTSIKLPQFIDSPFSECVKIVPQDIGRLPMDNWKLGQNSFLTHGYYRYKYIMLGKLKYDNKETYVIGVPGVYTNKEKYLANMFGFGLFVPVKKSDTKMGSFGYWVFEITRE